MTEIIEAPERAVTAMASGPAANSPMGMMMAAVKQGIPLDQIKEMMAIQRDWEADEARKASNEAFAAFKAEAVEIIKRKQVDFANSKGGRTQYKHAELSDVVEAVGPALSKHGFSWRWKPEQQGGKIKVTCYLQHRLGHQTEAWMEASPDDSGGKNSIQAIASTTTYLERHTLKAVCGLSEKGDDDDGGGAGVYRNALLDEWSTKVAAAQTESALRAVSREGQKIFNSKRDKVGFQDFTALVQSRAAEIQKGNQHA